MNSVYTLLSHLIEQLFPLSPDARVVQSLHETEVMSLYSNVTIENVTVLSAFRDARIRALIHEAKYHHNMRAYTLLGLLFSHYLRTCTQPIDLILPIPLSSRRMRARGYNQVSEVLQRATLPVGTTIHTNVLKRLKHTRPQTELTRKERLVNVRDAFGIAHDCTTPIFGKHIMIVDDVLTTGATLRTAKATLLPYGPASVTCVAFAH